LYPDIHTPQTLPFILARFIFLDPRAHEFFVDWEAMTESTVASLRQEAGRDLLEREPSNVVGELATRSEGFRVRWARHNVQTHRTAVKVFCHPIIDELQLTGHALALSEEGLVLIAYTAKRKSPAQEQLNFLASWSATHPSGLTAADRDESDTASS
jgi:hypothetical protein